MNKLVLKLLLVLAVLFFATWKLSSSVKFQLFGELIYQVIQQRKRGRCCHSPQLFTSFTGFSPVWFYFALLQRLHASY